MRRPPRRDAPAATGRGAPVPARPARARSRRPRKPTPKHPDRVFLPHAKDAIPIRPNTAEMFVLQHLRDEAHRFAVSFHRQQRKRLTLRSALSTIPGIGEGRQRLLLRHFGSLKKIRESSLEDLAAVPGHDPQGGRGGLHPLEEAAAARSRAPPARRPPAPRPPPRRRRTRSRAPSPRSRPMPSGGGTPKPTPDADGNGLDGDGHDDQGDGAAEGPAPGD